MSVFNTTNNINDLIKSTKRRLSLIPSNTKKKVFSRANGQILPSTISPIAKRVHFSENASLTTFSAPPREVVRAAWYNRRDIDNFKRDIRNDTLALRETMAKGKIENLAHSIAFSGSNMNTHEMGAFNSHSPCEKEKVVEGLEHLISPLVYNLICRRRKLAISRVIEEQEIQKTMGIEDRLRIAQVARNYSRFSKKWSCHLAAAEAA